MQFELNWVEFVFRRDAVETSGGAPDFNSFCNEHVSKGFSQSLACTRYEGSLMNISDFHSNDGILPGTIRSAMRKYSVYMGYV